MHIVKTILVMLLEDVVKQAVNRAPVYRHRLMGDWLIEIVGVADYLAVVGMARNGTEAVILRHIIQIVLSEVSLDCRSPSIDKTLTSGSVRLRSIDFTVIIRTDPDIGALAVIWVQQVIMLHWNVRILDIHHLGFFI